MMGSEEVDFEIIINYDNFKDKISQLGETNSLTKVIRDEEPESPIWYVKCILLLTYLEETVGGPEIFESFIKTYLETFKYKSGDTRDFITTFEAYLQKIPQ